MISKFDMKLILICFMALMIAGILMINAFQYRVDERRLSNEINFVQTFTSHIDSIGK